MVIHNATFMVAPSREAELAGWLGSRIADLPGIAARSPRLSALREAGGAESTADQPASIAFQLEFDTLAEALEWRAAQLAPLVADFDADFGPEAMSFVSVFEVLRP